MFLGVTCSSTFCCGGGGLGSLSVERNKELWDEAQNLYCIYSYPICHFSRQSSDRRAGQWEFQTPPLPPPPKAPLEQFSGCLTSFLRQQSMLHAIPTEEVFCSGWCVLKGCPLFGFAEKSVCVLSLLPLPKYQDFSNHKQTHYQCKQADWEDPNMGSQLYSTPPNGSSWICS
mmetsp:Transcript_121414/g.210996  ORF Transcript_121414/g.210996 Transcript_121414/m.210996 type:complete len:172 (+) Transcript_121414:2558-3073(+)